MPFAVTRWRMPRSRYWSAGLPGKVGQTGGGTEIHGPTTFNPSFTVASRVWVFLLLIAMWEW